MGYHVAASDGNMMVLGLREIDTKSAKDTFAAFVNVSQYLLVC